jgi:hypothetical protein
VRHSAGPGYWRDAPSRDGTFLVRDRPCEQHDSPLINAVAIAVLHTPRICAVLFDAALADLASHPFRPQPCPTVALPVDGRNPRHGPASDGSGPGVLRRQRRDRHLSASNWPRPSPPHLYLAHYRATAAARAARPRPPSWPTPGGLPTWRDAPTTTSRSWAQPRHRRGQYVASRARSAVCW